MINIPLKITNVSSWDGEEYNETYELKMNYAGEDHVFFLDFDDMYRLREEINNQINE